MDLDQLQAAFSIPGVLAFEAHGELVRARVHTAAAEATIYLQGAHVTNWQPKDQERVLFLSEHSAFTPGKAIRGGVPICFPWFGARSDGKPGPSHGFARTQPWNLAFAALMPDSDGGDRLQMTFVLGPTEQSRQLGFDNFRVVYEVMLGASLTLKLTVANTGTSPLHFEEALHAYYQVADVRQTALSGLESAWYLDKRDDGRQKQAPPTPLVLTEFSDRVFPDNSAALSIDDAGQQRTLSITKENSKTTVVWNPWPEGSAPLSDLDAEEWPHFLCVEAANTAGDAIVLQPGASHTLTNMIAVSSK